ncbi:lasso peptide biosynthesis B2 protein [Streptomyces sp. NPDC059816]|uniref:lasso peptide biosynthesis B2 protein n=1 Tax=Streptomyces sp. NPDC059816 TaxID=3346960 RepID=UPI00365CE73A
MTQMTAPPAAPTKVLRIPAVLALGIALTVRALPAHHRMQTRTALARATRFLPPAPGDRVVRVHAAVTASQPRWWPGQIDCKERALATVLATAFTGHHCHLVLGARTIPTAFHAWAVAADGTPAGADEAGGTDHPWTPVHTTP